jgi:adenylate cyclase
MVNKFIGDGIFAFWNPVIYPQPDHALLACETAVDLITALRELIEQKRRDKGDPAFGEIVLRAGIATGNAVVGPCGSEQKYDYTCIGDSVNVAARLESANKFYGTGTLISDGTRQAVGERFAFRPLGGVQVKGKTQAVQVYELLGRSGQVDPTTLEYAEDFGAAVECFQQRDWRAAIAAFESCRARRADDSAAQHYVDAANAFLSNPPDDDWNGAIELKEK